MKILKWLSKKLCQNVSAAELRQRVEKYISMVNLDHAKDKAPGEISGGMKQRVGIARALSITPKVLPYG